MDICILFNIKIISFIVTGISLLLFIFGLFGLILRKKSPKIYWLLTGLSVVLFPMFKIVDTILGCALLGPA